MSKRPTSPWQRFTLWQWGLLVIFAGLFANVMMGLMPLPAGGSAAARGQAFGRGAATGLAIVTGVVLIVMHFVRGRRRPRSEAPPSNTPRRTRSGHRPGAPPKRRQR